MEGSPVGPPTTKAKYRMVRGTKFNTRIATQLCIEQTQPVFFRRPKSRWHPKEYPADTLWIELPPLPKFFFFLGEAKVGVHIC